MVIRHEKYITFRCPECGLGCGTHMSIFDLSGKGEFEVKCTHCGNVCARIAKKADKLLFSVLCVACMEWHTFTANQKFFWGQKLTSYRCPVTGFGVLCVGDEESTKAEQQVFDEEMMDILGELEADFAAAQEEDYPGPDNERVMFAIVDKIYMLSKMERVHCVCSHPEILFDILNDRVHIFCENCGRDAEIMALTDEDLEKMMATDSIVLEGHEDE